MLAPIPYSDLAGYKRRTKCNPSDIDLVESAYPGYIAHRIAGQSSRINGRLKKRYLVPLGQAAPLLVASGTVPPGVSFTGRPLLGSLEMALQITLAGVLGVATFQWSKDGGQTYTAGGVTSGAAALAGTGLTAVFAATGPYALDNLYLAPTPVPEIAILWLVSLVDVDVWQRRGANPQDPQIAMAITERDAALAEMLEAANSETGLYDLPTNDAAGDSAVTQGGPMFYSEQSPYVWTDIQRDGGTSNDENEVGDAASTDIP